jgi:hypothetical protein
MIHHIYKELNLLLYIFINFSDFWFVILINFYEIEFVKNENWFVIHVSRTVISNPEIFPKILMHCKLHVIGGS